MAITSADVFVSPAAHATKQRWNATGSSLARMMPNWSCEGVPLANGRKRRRNESLARPKRAMSATDSAPASADAKHQKQHLVERIGDLALLPVVRQVLEMRQEAENWENRALRRPRECEIAMNRADPN